MNILVMSREKALNKIQHLSSPTLVLSIRTYGENIPNKFLDENIPNLTHIEFFEFNDVSNKSSHAMSNADAARIAKTVKNYQNTVDTILIHCDAGVSRSAGVGAALSKYLNEDDMEFFTSPRYMPNMHCYSLTLEALYGVSIGERFLYERKRLSDNLSLEDDECEVEFDNFGNVID